MPLVQDDRGRCLLMIYRTGILGELPGLSGGAPCKRLRLRFKICRCRIFVMAFTSLLMLGAISQVTAAVCIAIDGTKFFASKVVSENFSLALRSCRKPEANGAVQDTGKMSSMRIDASEYLKKTADNSAGLEARQLSLYDAEYATGIVLGEPFRVSNREWLHPPLVRQKNLRVAAEYFGSRAKVLAPRVRAVAEKYNIDPLLLHAIAHVESRHDPQAVSPAGALGLMQVMPATARRFGVNDPERELHDPRVNLEVSSIYLKKLQGLFGNDLRLILAAYNAGENAVIKYGRQIPPYRETQAYVRDVMSHYISLKP